MPHQMVKNSGAIIPYPKIKERKPDILQGPFDTDPVDALEVWCVCWFYLSHLFEVQDGCVR